MTGTTNILRAAHEYYGLGWCILPVIRGQKKPEVPWKELQEERPPESQLDRWFSRPVNIAALMGPVSGGLTCRDFDARTSYQIWASGHNDLATILPTVETARGFHVYFLSDLEGERPFDDGELRASRCITIVPPSIHKSGVTYRWLTPPTPENLLHIDDVNGAGFVTVSDRESRKHVTEKPEQTEQTEAYGAYIGNNGGMSREIEEAVKSTLPRELGTRNRQIFRLTQHLKSLPLISEAQAKDLRWVVEAWYRQALPFIRTKDFTETWCDFCIAWERVKYAKGCGPMQQAFDRAVRMRPPQIALEKYGGHKQVQALVALCCELQRLAGDNPFYLSTRAAAELLGVTHVQTSRWLFMLRVDGILREVSKGGTSENPRKATRYRYTGGK